MVFENKKVLIRVEYNVPLDNKGNITDNTRIKASIPTLKAILAQKPKQIILMFHLGRPDTKNPNSDLKTNKISKELEKLLKQKVIKVNHCGEEKLPNDKIVMLENLRFYEGEKKGDKIFAKQLAKLGDIYVNESFGTCHRKDASMYSVAKQFSKNKRYMGKLVENEVQKLSEAVKSKELTVIIGFAKIKDKLEIMKTLMSKSKTILIGGAVAFSFLKSEGLEVGTSLVDSPDEAGKLLKKFSNKILLPVDFVGLEKNKVKKYNFDEMSKSFCGFDVGDKTIKLFEKELKGSKVVFWNGPLGMFEKKPFDKGTNKLSEILSKSKAKVIVGGGDTALAAKKSGFANKFYHISTGGGASLEFIKKGNLPALKLIKKKI